MLQIATFSLPDDQDKANEFLKTHKPIGNIEFNKDMLFIGYETGDPTGHKNHATGRLTFVHNF